MNRIIRKKWEGHRHRASVRGIEFKLTFEEWVNWWETNLGPDWLKLRGHFKGQYVMARFNDEGPYELGNIKCITHVENTAEYNARNPRKGAAHPSCKFSEEVVRKVKFTKGVTTYTLAKQYGMSQPMVSQIRTGKKWGHIK